jgi:hypothetical protein
LFSTCKQEGPYSESPGCFDVFRKVVYENGPIRRTTFVFQDTGVEGRVRFGQTHQMRCIHDIENIIVPPSKVNVVVRSDGVGTGHDPRAVELKISGYIRGYIRVSAHDPAHIEDVQIEHPLCVAAQLRLSIL